MKRAICIFALISLVLLTFPIYADDVSIVEILTVSAAAETEDSTEETAPIDKTEAESRNNSKSASAFILFGTVTGAMILSALIHRVRDKGKYL